MWALSNCTGTPKAMAPHQRQLVGGVHAFDVEGGVGFGVAEALGFLQHGAEVQAPCRASRTG